MPWLTRLVLVSYWWALPLFSLVAIAVALVRQVVSLNQARATDAYLFFVAVVPSLVVLALHMPTLELLWKAYSLE